MWATKATRVHDNREIRDRGVPRIHIEIAEDLQESEQTGACTSVRSIKYLHVHFSGYWLVVCIE